MTPLQVQWLLTAWSVAYSGWMLFKNYEHYQRVVMIPVAFVLWCGSGVGVGVCIGWTWP